ncbi:MAG: hypothetical protein P0107_00845 [Nitrosomonas sp.]|nr:hypothetical protein [Nitrosomonas sp.]
MTKPKYQKVIAIALILGGAVAGISGYVHFRQAAVHSETGNTDSSHSPIIWSFRPMRPSSPTSRQAVPSYRHYRQANH